jgi:hypothetical protein
VACLLPGSHARYVLDAATKREVDAHEGTVRDIVEAATRTYAGDAYEQVAGAMQVRALVCARCVQALRCGSRSVACCCTSRGARGATAWLAVCCAAREETLD